jgi:arabinogalactan oligomer / maltooligosaccharide transport system substrate-binding protein/arabinogalactan oligomer / maltooligosaccharide transport system permease protein
VSAEGGKNGFERLGWGVFALVVLAVILFRPVTQLLKPVPAGVKIVVWHSQRGDERKTLEELLRRFNEQNVGRVYVEPLGVPDNSFKDKLVRNIPRGSGPDLFIRPHNELGEFHDESILHVVESANLPLARDAYLDKLLDGLSIDGKLYGYPLTYKGLFQFYNTELCPDGPPRDTRDFEAWKKRLPEGVVPLAYDASNPFFHAPFLIGSGGKIFGDDGKTFAIFKEPSVTSFRWPGEWKRSGVLPPEPNYNEMVRLFQSGRAATIICGPWYQPGGDIGKSGKWDIAPLFDVNGTPTGSFVTVEGVYVSAQTKHPERAAEVAAFLSGPIGEQTRFERLSLPPVSRAAYDKLDQEATKDGGARRVALVRVQRQSLQHGVVTPNSSRVAAMWTPATDLLSASLAGREFDKAVADSAYMLARVDEPKPPPADWRPYGIVLVVLLSIGTYFIAMQARRGIRGDEAMRAKLTGFHARAALPYLGPGLLAVALLVFAPLIVGAALSLYTHEHGTFTFTGLQNFGKILFPPLERAFQSRSFYFALVVTVVWTLTNVVLHVTIGVAMALLLRPSWNRLRTFYRLLLILPWAIPNYITALMWKGMFNAQVGAVNVLLSPFGFEGYNWFDKFLPAFTANLVTNTWLGFPFMMVVTLGALQSIPSELEEAATLDGATRWQRFRLVVFPHVRPALLPAIILGSVWTFNMFNIIYLVSGGEPNSQTDILISEAYRWAFERGQRFGYAAAYSVLIFFFLLFYSRMTERIQKGRAS